MMDRAGVYLIINTKDKKIYVGESLNLRRRYAEHKRKLYKKQHCNTALQEDFNKLGNNNFIFRKLIILNFDTENKKEYVKDLLKELEKRIIDYISVNTKIQLYNVCDTENNAQNFYYLHQAVEKLKDKGYIFLNYKVKKTLLELGIIKKNNTVTQKYVDEGYFFPIIKRGKTNNENYIDFAITEKGLELLEYICRKNNIVKKDEKYLQWRKEGCSKISEKYLKGVVKNG